MAVEKWINHVSLRAVVNAGIDPETGEFIYKKRSFSGIKQDTTPDDAYDVLSSIMSLQKYSVDRYEQIDTSDLLEQ